MQFGKQEPGTDQEIKEFATLNYGAEFPLFSKVKVNGSDAEPLWKVSRETESLCALLTLY